MFWKTTEVKLGKEIQLRYTPDPIFLVAVIFCNNDAEPLLI